MPVDFANARNIRIENSPINDISGNNNVQNSNPAPSKAQTVLRQSKAKMTPSRVQVIPLLLLVQMKVQNLRVLSTIANRSSFCVQPLSRTSSP